jgi:hypothetical protein
MPLRTVINLRGGYLVISAHNEYLGSALGWLQVASAHRSSRYAWSPVLTGARLAGVNRVSHLVLRAVGWRGKQRLVAVGWCRGLYGGGDGGYGTAVGEAVSAAGAAYGFPAVRTGFTGRAGPAREPAILLERFQLVAVTVPAGSRRTRLAGQRSRGGGRAGSQTGRGPRQRRARCWWPAACAAREGRGRVRGMPGRPLEAGGPGRAGVTCGGVAL